MQHVAEVPNLQKPRPDGEQKAGAETESHQRYAPDPALNLTYEFLHGFFLMVLFLWNGNGYYRKHRGSAANRTYRAAGISAHASQVVTRTPMKLPMP